ncbi:MAG: urease accessory protein UreF [Ginsengibacter sp.]
MYSPKLLHLLHLCDPALPIGGFSHSAGLETYVQEGIVNNLQSAREFVVRQLSQNILFTDAALVSLAYDAARIQDIDELIDLDQICNAVKLPAEIRAASNKLGIRLLKIFWDNKNFLLINEYKSKIAAQHVTGHYCIVFGLLAQALEINKAEALTGFYFNTATGFITNAVKLIPLGQQDGQELLMSMFPLISELVQKSISANKDHVGFCCAGFDIRSMQHEQLYSRLYMS